jgi:hypothetical protein
VVPPRYLFRVAGHDIICVSASLSRRVCIGITRPTCTGLRGEEMLPIDLFGTAKSVSKFMQQDSPDPHFKFVIIGRTKGIQEDGHMFAIPCVRETQGTHLRPGVCLEHLLEVKNELGQTHGKKFRETV